MGMDQIPATGQWTPVAASATYFGTVQGPIDIKSFRAENKGGSQIYLMFFDSATLPANGSIPIYLPIPMPSTAIASDDLPMRLRFTSGVYWVASSTDNTLTVATGATVNVSVGY